MEQLLKEIKRIYIESDEVFAISEESEKEYEYLQNYINSLDKDKYNLAAIDHKNEFILAALCAKKDGEPFSYFKKQVSKFKKLDNSSNDKINIIVKICKRFIDANLLEELANIPLLDNNDGTIEKIVSEHNDEYAKFYNAGLIDYLTILHISLRKTFCDNEEGRIAFFNLLKKYPNDFLTILHLISNRTLEVADINKNMTENIQDVFISTKNATGIKLKRILEEIEERVETLRRENISRISKKGNIDKKLEKIKKCLQEGEKNKIIEITPTLFNLLENEDVKLKVIKYILEHNCNSYIKLEKELLEHEKKSELEKIFNNSIFSFNSLTEEEKKLLATFGNLENIIKIIQIFNDSNFEKINTSTFPLIDVLLLSNTNIVNNIGKYFSQRIISEDFIINNPEIFIESIPEELKPFIKTKEAKSKDFSGNVNLLRDKKANILAISQNNPNLLLENNNVLESNIQLLDQYGINYEKAKELSIANNINLICYLDIFIELGLYTYVKNNPDIINKDVLTYINRLLLCKQLGIPLIEKKKLNSVITGSSFRLNNLSIDDKDIFDYLDISVFRYADSLLFKELCSNSSNNDINFNIEKLEQFKKNDQVYDINGVKVSRNKVLRNYSILRNSNVDRSEEELIFNSIIFGSMYNSDDLDTLSNSINNISLIKEKR